MKTLDEATQLISTEHYSKDSILSLHRKHLGLINEAADHPRVICCLLATARVCGLEMTPALYVALVAAFNSGLVIGIEMEKAELPEEKESTR
jgi:hypothetical protein